MDFLTAQEQIPDGNGFALFHTTHLVILLFICCVLVLCIRLYRHSTQKRLWQWGIVTALLLLEVLKQGILLATNLVCNIYRWISVDFLSFFISSTFGNHVPISENCFIAFPCQAHCWHSCFQIGIVCRSGIFSVSIALCCICYYYCFQSCCLQMGHYSQTGTDFRSALPHLPDVVSLWHGAIDNGERIFSFCPSLQRDPHWYGLQTGSANRSIGLDFRF